MLINQCAVASCSVALVCAMERGWYGWASLVGVLALLNAAIVIKEQKLWR